MEPRWESEQRPPGISWKDSSCWGGRSQEERLGPAFASYSRKLQSPPAPTDTPGPSSLPWSLVFPEGQRLHNNEFVTI